MKILLVNYIFFPEYYGGAERFALNLAKQLQRNGHFVKILTYINKEETNNLPTLGDRFFYKEYEYDSIPVIAVRHRNIPTDVDFEIYDKHIEDLLKIIIAKEDYDIVHLVNSVKFCSVIKAAKDLNKPVVLTLISFWPLCPKIFLLKANTKTICTGPRNGLECLHECYPSTWKQKIISRQKDAKFIFDLADIVVSPSFFLKSVFNLNKWDREIKVIKYGVDYSYIKPKKDNYINSKSVTFGFIGTIQSHKGVDILVRAFDNVELPNISLKVYGGYFEANYYETIVKISKNNTKIKLLGEYDHNDFPQIMRDIDIVIVPSIWFENNPMVINLSLAYKIPVIVSNMPGMTEQIKDGFNGFTFEPGNIKQLTSIITRIGRNPEVLNSLRENIINPSRVEEEAFEYERLYYKLVNT